MKWCIVVDCVFSIFCFLQDIDHVGYVRQAFEASSFNCFLEILESDLFNESDVSLISVLGFIVISLAGLVYLIIQALMLPFLFIFSRDQLLVIEVYWEH